ncbi:MAG: hypothetical protein MRY74_11265 [Neomegalonema sp.]|nr:hypothetical protein [Neomegalonema sp.]
MTTQRKRTVTQLLKQLGVSALMLTLALSISYAAKAGPLPERECADLRDGLEKLIEITPAFEMWTDIVDMPPLGKRKACRLKFRGTGVIFERAGRRGFDAAVQTIRKALATQGWLEGPAQSLFAADGPLGTRFGVSKLSNVCVVSVSLDEARALGAPVPESPVSEGRLLGLNAAKRIYTIELACITPARQ